MSRRNIPHLQRHTSLFLCYFQCSKGGVSDGQKRNLSEVIPIYQITVYKKSVYKHPVSSIPSFQLLPFFSVGDFHFFLTKQLSKNSIGIKTHPTSRLTKGGGGAPSYGIATETAAPSWGGLRTQHREVQSHLGRVESSK